MNPAKRAKSLRVVGRPTHVANHHTKPATMRKIAEGSEGTRPHNTKLKYGNSLKGPTLINEHHNCPGNISGHVAHGRN